jgi:hypothetical protein
MAHRVTTVDALAPGVFRKLRHALGVTAFGAGTAGFEVDGEMVDPADVERRLRLSAGDMDAIRRRDRSG